MAILTICEKHGWTLSQWKSLAEQEKRIWLAWYFRRRKQVEAITDALKQGEKLTPESFTLLTLEM